MCAGRWWSDDLDRESLFVSSFRKSQLSWPEKLCQKSAEKLFHLKQEKSRLLFFVQIWIIDQICPEQWQPVNLLQSINSEEKSDTFNHAKRATVSSPARFPVNFSFVGHRNEEKKWPSGLANQKRGRVAVHIASAKDANYRQSLQTMMTARFQSLCYFIVLPCPNGARASKTRISIFW